MKNVILAKTRYQEKKLVKQAFWKGYSQYNGFNNLKERWRQYKLGKTNLKDVVKGIIRLFYKPTFAKMHSPEKGYAYFQDFIPNNLYDIRICIVGDKAFALKRLCRKNDFRASRSGNKVYHKEEIDDRCLKIAFDTNEQIHSQSIAYDFVFDENNNPLIVELSYGYSANAYDYCEGYWTKDMQWHGLISADGWLKI